MTIIVISDGTRMLDLACGKGAVSVKVAHKLRVKVKGNEYDDIDDSLICVTWVLRKL